jgi:hypothetical protein
VGVHDEGCARVERGNDDAKIWFEKRRNKEGEGDGPNKYDKSVDFVLEMAQDRRR